jgi:iron complex outermembrane receptor protein
MQNRACALRSGVSILAATISLALLTTTASAQASTSPAAGSAGVPLSPPEQDQPIPSEIVVTGTSIRGVAPVGSNLISVGQAELKQTGATSVEQALANVPALTGLGSVGIGQTNNSYYQPTIHSLGASASNSTLILIDGHRPPTGGTNHSTADPNIVPFNMIERVEVLPDGASAVYGSDAVAGVVNFITRKKFDGLQVNAQQSFADGQHGFSAGVLTGKNWDRGSAILAFTYTNQSALDDTDRDYTNWNHIAQGGTNFGNFNCGPATLQPGGAGPIFLNATSGVSRANSAANSPCSQWADGVLVQRELRYNLMGKVSQDITNTLTLSAEGLWSRRRDSGITPAGTVTATAFRSGPQANPFYQAPAGYTGTSNNETVRWDADDLFGPGITRNGSDTMYADANLAWHIGSNFVVNALAVAGRDDSKMSTSGVINGSVANLALNGTTNSAGSTTQVSIPGTNVVVLGLPLTAANALDVWNPAATNKTSAAVRAALLDNGNLLRLVSRFQQYRVSIDGTLFDLPAGPVRVAVGGEIFRTQLTEYVDRANNSGPASNASQQLNYDFQRTVHSGYAELDAPLIGPDMHVPLVHKFDVNISGRYDHYSDFGSTFNPKYAFNWDVIDGLRIRGNRSTSFVAPPLDVLGDQYGSFATAGWNSVTNNLAVPVAAYPILTQLGIPGCTAASTTCNISSLQGIQVTSGDHHAKAQKGKGWSVGADFTPRFLPGFHAQATLWDTEFTGGVTGPNISNAVNNSGLNDLLTFYPGGATAAQIAAATQGIPQRTTTPTVTNYIYRSLNSNFLNLKVRGIDASFDYHYQTSKIGTLSTGLTITEFLKFDQSYGVGGHVYSVLNTSGSNTSFPSVRTQGRASLGWALDGFDAEIFVNYTGSYRNYSGNSVTPIIRDAFGNPAGGGDKVRSNTTFDMHAAYTFKGGFMDGTELSISGRNILNKKPPFYNSTLGYDTYVASPLGRVITVGLIAKLL